MCAWNYSYRTREGEWRSGCIAAAGREDAFARLKARGIRPIRVTLAPGLWNRLKAFGRLGWAMALLVLALAGAVCGLVAFPAARPGAAESAIAPLPRQRIPNLPPDYLARVQSVFPTAAERFLARFAEPGREPQIPAGEAPSAGRPPPAATPARLSLADLDAALKHPLALAAADPPWLTMLKRIVVGMKRDAALLREQGRPPADIELWLRERQKMEATYRSQILSGPGGEAAKAARLRAMGL